MSSDHTPTALPAYGPAPSDPTCEGCGRAVSPEIARVVGGNDGTVARCRHCTAGVSRTTAAATGAHADGLRVAPAGRRGGAER
jgi:hypothetical protein